MSAGFNRSLTIRHELRLKLQAIGPNAKLRQACRIDADNAIPTDEPVDDFSVSNLGLQVRYRYELAPLPHYSYVVNGRGGFEQSTSAEDSDRLVRDSFSLRDHEQLLIKLES